MPMRVLSGHELRLYSIRMPGTGGAVVLNEPFDAEIQGFLKGRKLERLTRAFVDQTHQLFIRGRLFVLSVGL